MKARKSLDVLFTLSIIFIICPKSIASPNVGVFYYPWYGPDSHSTQQSLRGHLVSEQWPELGSYNSQAMDVIGTHIEYSVHSNIKFWLVSWWGPDSYEDIAFKDCILEHEKADRLKYAILYESTSRLGSFENPDYSNLIPDVQYMKDNYFDNPNYLKIDNRPVVFIYLTRAYFRGQGDQALTDLRAAFPELYIIADDVFGPNYSSSYAAKWDAVTAYDGYGQSLGMYGSTQAGMNYLNDIQSDAKGAANSAGVGFIPFAFPGFNDKGVRTGHRVAPRYFEDDPCSVEGDVFDVMLKDVVAPHVDPLADNMIVITSFNEWHEDTQIEPTVGTGDVTNTDDSLTGTDYTQGYYYKDYGSLYLDILFEDTTGTIQQAIAAADDGDIVTIEPGVYQENINFLGKKIVLKSEDPNDPCVVTSTVILGSGNIPVVSFNSGEDANSLISGFTISGGCEGVLCLDSGPIISKCIISDNKNTGITAKNSNPVIVECLINDNDNWGINVLAAENPRDKPYLLRGADIKNCKVTGNTKGGIYSNGRNYISISNSIVAGNLGVGAHIRKESNALLINNTITENYLQGIYSEISNINVTNNIIWSNRADQVLGNVTSAYNDVQGGLEGLGNIDHDPCFVSIGYWDNSGTPADVNDDLWTAGAYHLKSQAGRYDFNTQNWIIDSVTSPAIEAGNPGCVLKAEVDSLNNCRINMGAFGGTEQASKAPEGWGLLGDINNDFIVNSSDLLLFTGYWMDIMEFVPGDFNRDGFVDMVDYSLFANTWYYQR